MSGSDAQIPDLGQDEGLLIDYVLGRCDEAQAEGIRQRLESEPELAARRDELSSALAALGEWKAPEPPENLVERTLARVSAQRRSEALVAGRSARRSFIPTFSMRELGAIAAAMLIAVGIFVPSLQQAQRQAQRSACAANQGRIGTGLLNYAQSNDGVLPASPANTGPWLASERGPGASNSAGLFVLVRGGLADADAFRCPAMGGESFELRSGMIDFPSARSIGYSYQHTLAGSPSLTELANVADDMKILADNTPAFVNGAFRPERAEAISENHGGRGQNVLDLTGRVVWAKSNRIGVNDNNIFLAEGVTMHLGREAPASPTDSFLLPNGR